MLTASVTKSRGTSAKYTIDSKVGSVGGTQGSGEIDPTSRSQSTTLAMKAGGKTIHEQLRMVGSDIYVKMDMSIPGVDGKKWMHLDTTKLKSLSSLGLGNPSDPTNLGAYSKEIVSVQQTAPGKYQGILDITKAPLPSITSSILAQAGDALKSVPFEATTDDQSRLTSMTVKMPPLGANVPASTTTVKFSDFGTPVSVQAPPASQTQEAPALLYSALGG
jgi:hypothetical protein